MAVVDHQPHGSVPRTLVIDGAAGKPLGLGALVDVVFEHRPDAVSTGNSGRSAPSHDRHVDRVVRGGFGPTQEAPLRGWCNEPARREGGLCSFVICDARGH